MGCGRCTASFGAHGNTGAMRTLSRRFELGVLLQSDRGIQTWSGRDLETSSEVVIKTAAVAEVPLSVQTRMEQIAEALRGLDNPCLVPPLHIGREGDQFFVVSPWTPGDALATRLRSGPLRLDDALTVARHLASTLRDVHRRGVLHGHLTPGNVILTEVGGRVAARIIDFGPMRHGTASATQSPIQRESLLYLSPEKAGLLHSDVDERSDLYSAGVVFYACLAGAPPFTGETVGEVLRQHLTARPADLRSRGIKLPVALEEMVQRLLRKDPRDRYQTADALVADLEEVTAALALGVADPVVSVGARDRRTTLTSPAFIGRVAELAALESWLDRAGRGVGGLVLLEAESGGGKTRLLDEAAFRGAGTGSWVLRGQGLAQGAARPFQVLAGVVGEIGHGLAADPAMRDRLRAGLGDHLDAACAALPALAESLCLEKTDGREALSQGPEAHGAARTHAALIALLDALSTAQRPCVILLDDCQWADEMTVQLLRAWQRGGVEGAVRHVVIVAAFRSEEVSAEHPLRHVAPSAHLVLSALGPSDLTRLVESMAGPVPPRGYSCGRGPR